MRKIADKAKCGTTTVMRKINEQIENLPHNNDVTKQYCNRFCGIIVICDDNENIRKASEYIFPNVIIQLCQNHFLENIRKGLHSRTDDTYKPFVVDLKRELFSMKLFVKYAKDEVAVKQLLKINEYTKELTASMYVRKAPMTTNIIESFNSHLQGRLKTIKGFESFKSADKWINAYILRRRLKKFTDCCPKFRYLNGKTSFSRTCKKEFQKQGVLPLFT